MTPLSHDHPTAFFTLGDLSLRYSMEPKSGQVEFLPLPAALADACVPRVVKRPSHPSFPDSSEYFTWISQERDSLVQVAVRGLSLPKNWSAGHSLRNQEAALSLRFQHQEITDTPATEGTPRRVEIATQLSSPHGFSVVHFVSWQEGDGGVLVWTTLTNNRDTVLEVEMLSSFSLAGMTPFVQDDAPGRLHLHRFRSAWSNEARLTVETFEQLHLERTWGAGPVALRFGQAGSLPVRGHHPCAVIEDRAAGVFWGAHLAWLGSWQLEVYRRDDAVALSGGLGDFELAHWMKSLAPGETLTTPVALVATGQEDADAFYDRMVRLQSRLAAPEPAQEQELPIIFNEWCSTWGHPTHEYVLRTAERLQQTPTRYFVIDDGWAQKPPGEAIQFNGDWNVDETAFPGGLAPTCAALRERGLIPGLWFEFEPCTAGTEAYEMHDHQLQLHGKVLQTGNRHFWDFRDPWTFDYLTEKVIRQLHDSGFGYLKVDYNESIGLGCDGAESLGEGLRAHLIKVREFFEKIRREVPGIVIENCSSGGHRSEPGMVGLTSMTSFSDAHETVEIPIIAASLHRLIPAQKNQVWAVIRPTDSVQRLHYSLSAPFLGRMCLSGDLVDLSEDRFAVIQAAQQLYVQAAPVIRDGTSRLHQHTGASRRYPTGWQAVVRSTETQALVVVHSFAGERPENGLAVALPAGSWKHAGAFGHSEGTHLEKNSLHLPPWEDFCGGAFLFERSDQA